MKGLMYIPTLNDLQKAYQKVQINPRKISTDEWVLWSQWSRFDARLAEQLISTLSLQWKKISPVEWNEKILKQPWPAAMGVLLNHLEQQLLKDKREHQLFRSWSKTVMTGISKADGEQFFIGTAIIGSHRMKKDSLSPTKLYLDWGYLGSDYLWNKSKPARTISKKSSRKNVLDELIQRKRKFTVKQYIAELNGFVTVRQAQRDLMNHPKLKKTGNTRGAVYFPISSQR